MKKEKVFTPEQIEKQRRRDEREIERLEREQKKPRGPAYLICLIIYLTIIYIADEVATQIGTQMQSILASQIFAPIVGADVAVARMSVVTTVAMVMSMLAFLYKPLSDRYGRRIFLFINTVGMGIGMIIVGVCTGIPVYVIGAGVIAFFIPHDMQAVYILESTPAKHRAKIYSIIKACATLGMLLIPVLRRLFIPTSDLSRWRFVYIVPAIITLVIAFVALFCIRETDAFVESRLRQLKMTDEEKAEARAKNQDVDSRGGLIKALKFAFKHKQLRWLFISAGFIMFGMSMTSYYETTMAYGYAQPFLAGGMELEAAKGEATRFVTQALMLFPVGSALLQLTQGFFADKWGRKPATIVMCAASVISFTLFYFGANNSWMPELVGFLSGAAVGSFWASTDIAGTIMCSESTPTNLRSSVNAVQPMVSGFIYSLDMILVLVLINVLGDANIGLICLVTAVPGMLVGLILMCLKVKETKGSNLGDIRGDEFES